MKITDKDRGKNYYKGHNFELITDNRGRLIIQCACCEEAKVKMNVDMDALYHEISNQPIKLDMQEHGLPERFLRHLEGPRWDPKPAIKLSKFCMYSEKGVEHFYKKEDLGKSVTASILSHNHIYFIISDGKYVDNLFKKMSTIVSTKL